MNLAWGMGFSKIFLREGHEVPVQGCPQGPSGATLATKPLPAHLGTTRAQPPVSGQSQAGPRTGTGAEGVR